MLHLSRESKSSLVCEESHCTSKCKSTKITPFTVYSKGTLCYVVNLYSSSLSLSLSSRVMPDVDRKRDDERETREGERRGILIEYEI